MCRRRRWWLSTGVMVSLAIAAVGCQSSPRGPQKAERLVLVSYDGLGANLASRWLDSGLMADEAGIAGMVRHGFSVGRLKMVNPALTAVNHASLLAGLAPSGTGIVSNLYRNPGQPLNELVNGFDAVPDSENLVAAAGQESHRVGVILWPGNGADDRGRGAFGLEWPTRRLARGEVLELDPGTASTGGEIPSHDDVAPLLWNLEVELSRAEPSTVDVLIMAVDGNPDGQPRYDTVAVRRVRTDEWTLVAEREWFSIELAAWAAGEDSTHPWGAWCKVLDVDRWTGMVRLYRGAFHRAVAYPRELELAVENEIGFWPGPPDQWQIEDWWLDAEQGIDLDTYLEQLRRLDRWIDRVTTLVLERESFDLLLAYHPAADEYQHSSLILDEDQLAFSPGRALASREGMKQVAESIEVSVAGLWRQLEPSRDALVVVSDHGLLPIHDVVHLNQALAKAGLVELTTAERGARVAPESPMIAVASGACAHLYLNLEDREPEGVVAVDDAAETLRRAARVLAELSVDGRPVVERIVNRDEASSVGLDHPSTGDLVVFLAPGFAATMRVGGEVSEPARYAAQHGYLAHHDGMNGILFARGAGIQHDRLEELPATRVAPLVASWLGWRFPRPQTPTPALAPTPVNYWLRATPEVTR